MRVVRHLLDALGSNYFILLALFLPLCIMTAAFAIIKLSPFGDRQIMVIDSWHQYYPFFYELQSKLRHGGSLFYSWHTGGGTNFLSLISYYAASPLYLFSVLFPEAWMREFFMAVTMVKISLAGMFFAIFLRGRFQRNDIAITLFGVMYACCGYLTGYYWCIMWLDGVALLPLVMLGLHKVLDGKSIWLYVLTLALALASSFYIGYFICLYIVLYFLLQWSRKPAPFSWQGAATDTVKIAAVSILGVCLAAIMLLPAYHGLKNAYGLASQDPTQFKLYQPVLDLLNRLLPASTPTVRGGLPNLYSGFLALLLLPMYFFLSSVPLRQKVAHGGLIVLLLLSMDVNYLDFIWHGFHFPNEVPFRFAFVFSFTLLVVAFEVYGRIDEIMPSLVKRVAAVGVVYLLLYDRLMAEKDKHDTFLWSILFLAGWAGIYGLSHIARRHPDGWLRKVIPYVMAALVLLDGGLMAVAGAKETGSTGYKEYPPQQADMALALEKTASLDPGLYRLEIPRWYSVNDPVLYGYNGVSQFSSVADRRQTGFAEKMGLSANLPSNRYVYMANTPVVNALYGIRYLIGKGDANQLVSSYYEKSFTQGEVTMYRNRYDVGMGFMADDALMGWVPQGYSAFDNQAAFIATATGVQEPIFDKLEATEITYDKAHMTQVEGVRTFFSVDGGNKRGTIKGRHVVRQSAQIYGYMHVALGKDAKVVVNDRTISVDPSRGYVVDLGHLEAGTEIITEIPVEGTSGAYVMEYAAMNEANWEAAFARLADETLTVKTHADTRLDCTIDVKEGGLLYFAIPYDKGWRLTLDGVRHEPVKVADARLGVEVGAGTHELTLTYAPEGFSAGVALSLAALVVAALWEVARKASEKRR